MTTDTADPGIFKRFRPKRTVVLLGLLTAIIAGFLTFSEFRRQEIRKDLDELVERLQEQGEKRSHVSDDIVILRDSKDFSDEDLHELLEVSNPIVLDLAGTRITDEAVEEISNLPRLSYLNLAGTKITDAAVRQLADSYGIEHLNLSRTAIDGTGFDEWPSGHHLQSLWLEDSQLTDESFRTITSQFIVASVLSVARTNITDKAFTGPPSVRVLNLSGTRVTRDCLKHFYKSSEEDPFSYLLWLDVSETEITSPDLIEAFRSDRYWLELQPRPWPDAEERWLETSLVIQDKYGQRESSREMQTEIEAARHLVGLYLSGVLAGTPVGDLTPLLSDVESGRDSVDLFGWAGEGMAGLLVRSNKADDRIDSIVFYSPEF